MRATASYFAHWYMATCPARVQNRTCVRTGSLHSSRTHSSSTICNEKVPDTHATSRQQSGDLSGATVICILFTLTFTVYLDSCIVDRAVSALLFFYVRHTSVCFPDPTIVTPSHTTQTPTSRSRARESASTGPCTAPRCLERKCESEESEESARARRAQRMSELRCGRR